MRGRNNRSPNGNKGPNPLTRSYESNGPDVKIRGTAQNVADKYAQLARDAQSSGDPVAAENYFQHAEHYYRIIAAAQDQYRQQYGAPQRNGFDDDEDGDGDDAPTNGFNGQPGYGYGHDYAGDDYEGGQGQPQQQRGQPYENRQDRNNDRDARSDRDTRNERGDRQNGRPNRFNDRPDRRDRFHDRDRQDRDRQAQPNGNRQDGGRQDYARQEGPRQDYARQDGPRQDAPRFEGGQGEGYRGGPNGGESYVRHEAPARNEAPTRNEVPARQELSPRPEPAARSEPRRERRREEPLSEMAETGGLPAFLTAPVRSPAPTPEEPVGTKAASAEAGADEAGLPARPRRRRRTRYEGIEGAAPTGDLLLPTDTSSAE